MPVGGNAPSTKEPFVASTLKSAVLVPVPPVVVTLTRPVMAVLGTLTVIAVLLQPPVTTAAVTPLNFTVLEPWVEPKLVP